MDIGLQNIRYDSLARIEGNDFEDLCSELISFEFESRHAGTGRIYGPPPRSTGDGGRDLSLEVAGTPRRRKEDFPYRLTEDEPVETVFSCKSGRHWEKGVKKDAEKQPRPLEVLERGGYYMILVHVRVDEKKEKREKKKTLRQEVAALLHARLKQRDPNAPDPIGRIQIYDANHLIRFIRYHKPSISARFKHLLGVVDVPDLSPIDGWAVSLLFDRPIPGAALPEFCSDPGRDEIRQLIRHMLGAPADPSAIDAPGEHVLWVYGAPGVGKTRLVLEALRGVSDLDRRVQVARTYEMGLKAIRTYDIFSHFSDIILVVDECPPEDAPKLARLLPVTGEGSCALILIGPPPREGALQDMSYPPYVEVKPLEQEPCRRLVEQELGVAMATASGAVESIWRLCEGYPWFAVLLARAVLQRGPEALPASASDWDAAELVLAPRGEHRDDASWRNEALLRARALLVAMLTDDMPWGDLAPDYQHRLASAVGVPSWGEVSRAAENCRNRGLLRVRGEGWKFKYVTPNNLARIVATKLLGEGHWLGGCIRRFVPELESKLHAMLSDLGVRHEILEQLASEAVDGFLDGPPSQVFARGHPVPRSLSFVARWQPARTARLLRLWADHTPLEELRARVDLRRELVASLEHLSRRSVSFEDAEAALFRLALAENEGYGNNASGVWKSLFFVELNPTQRSFSERIELLKQRLCGSPEERRLALGGVATAISPSGILHSSNGGGIDGPWLIPSRVEANQSRREAWELICELTQDADPEIASAARRSIDRSIHGAVRLGDGAFVLRAISTVVITWPEADVARLRESLGRIDAHEGTWLRAQADLTSAVDGLRAVTQPRTYHQRLLEGVGRSRPSRGDVPVERWKDCNEHLDLELATDGISSPIPLLDELEWLESKEAVRTIAFMVQVGRADTSRLLLEPLVRRALAGVAHDTLPAYLLGVAKAGYTDEVDTILRSWRGESKLSTHALLTIWRMGPTDERIAWIIEDLESGRVAPGAASCLALGGWVRSADPRAVARLVTALAGMDALDAQAAALELILDRTEVEPAEFQIFMPVLPSLLDVIAQRPEAGGMIRYSWERGSRLLIRHGRADVALSSAFKVIQAHEDIGEDEDAWSIICECVAGDPARVWRMLSTLLEERSRRAYQIPLEAMGHQILTKIPADEVLAWVGHDVRRSVLVAQMCPVHESPLNGVARALIVRFGPDSEAASVLSGQAHTTPMAVTSLAAFFRSQLEHAKVWAADREASVAKWGRSIVEELLRSLEEQEAHEEHDRRRWGT